MNPKRSVYGPDQFTEEDVLAVAREMEKEDPAKPGEQEDAMSGDDDDDDRSKSDSCQKKRCSQCQVVSIMNYYSFDSSPHPGQGSLRRAVVSLVCWHVHCQKCWLQQLVNINILSISEHFSSLSLIDRPQRRDAVSVGSWPSLRT